jgi:hypothetical protein
VRTLRLLPLAALLVLAGAPVGRAADSSPEEAAYDTAAAGWQRDWAARPAAGTIDHPVCTKYWQTGDAIRRRMKAASVPAARTSYHTALLAYVDAALAAADECLAQSRVTLDWVAKNREARRLRQELRTLVRTSGLRLPTDWH